MKRIFTLILALILCASLLVVPAFAEEPTDEAPDGATDTTVDAPDTPDTPKITPEGEAEAFTDQLVAFLTDGATWAKFGGIVAAILAVLGVLYKYTSGIKSVIGGVKSLVEGKATKAETEKLIKDEGDKILSGVLECIEDTKKKQDELTEKYNEQTAILTLITLQLVKSPHARTEIMKIISTAKTHGKDAAELVEVIEAEIKAAEEAEEKIPTPALDAIITEVNGDTGATDGVALG